MSKETLVLLPGLLCDEAVWVHQRAALGDRVDTVVPDYAELGSIEGMARKVLAEVRAPEFSLAGHSMGGRVALEVARLAPERVRRLALLDTGYEPIAAGEAGAQEREKRMKLLQHAKAHGMREMGQLWAPGMVHPERLGTPLFNEILEMIERRTPEQFEAQINALLGRPDAGPVLRKLHCPTAIICGREDTWSPYSRHEAMSHMVPAPWVSLHAVEQSGHMSTMEQPEAVSVLLDAWLSRTTKEA
tara:strand:+ start:74293 stop:75027 length:735 start_codon:yes stop_codon:yes gene_type:complete